MWCLEMLNVNIVITRLSLCLSVYYNFISCNLSNINEINFTKISIYEHAGVKSRRELIPNWYVFKLIGYLLPALPYFILFQTLFLSPIIVFSRQFSQKFVEYFNLLISLLQIRPIHLLSSIISTRGKYKIYNIYRKWGTWKVKN